MADSQTYYEASKNFIDSKKQFLNYGDDDQMEIEGYCINRTKSAAVWIGYILTFGLLRLFFHWNPQLQLVCTHSKCPLETATRILITDDYKGRYKSYFVKRVVILRANDRSEGVGDESDAGLSFSLYKSSRRKCVNEVRAFWCKKMCYVWDSESKSFLKLTGLDGNMTCLDLLDQEGCTINEQRNKRIIYGENQIAIPVKSIAKLLILEALTPFYIFQVFSLIVWFCEYYYYYTIAIIIMSISGITLSVVQTRKNQRNLRGTVQSTDKVMVRRKDGSFEFIPTTHLVPGDIIVIQSHGCVMHCDAVLLNGSCIVNESMLTGESVPVTKTPIPATNKIYDVKKDANHTLYCGTTVIQTRFYGDQRVFALVVRTGFLTTKGQLVKSILYPPPVDFKFDQDSYKFIGILTIIAIAGVVYTVISKSTRNINPLDILVKALDLITIAIPPALPAAMTVGKLYALGRLKTRGIYCINSKVINVSGSINCVCFDKTGTLTENGMDLWGAVPVVNNNFEGAITDIKSMSSDDCYDLLKGMVTCHSLTYMGDEIIGDPLDVKMFKSTEWILEEPEIDDSAKYDLLMPTVVKSSMKENALQIGIVHQYQFSSDLRRMSVITRTLGSERFEVFCKGSPETVLSLSKPESIPHDAFERLSSYTAKGYRVIGIGMKTLGSDVNFHKLPSIPREEVEKDLNFVGYVIFENRLKPETASIIKLLKETGMKIVMITGDNIQTALSVARECGIVDKNQNVFEVTTCKGHKSERDGIRYSIIGSVEEFNFAKKLRQAEEADVQANYCIAMTGCEWENVRKNRPGLIAGLVEKGAVFARTSSEQKQQIIQELQNLGFYVAMCGDGANDCAALKAAHVGISLSEAESSVASPFTSKEENISCVTEVVREGRAALVTSFGVFKFMLCYSLTEFTSVIILYGIDSNLTSIQFLFIDICLILNFASFFGKTEAYDGPMSKTAPPDSLLGLTPLLSIGANIASIIIFQTIAYHVVRTYVWYEPFVFDPERSTYFSCYENTAVFTISMFQYIMSAVVFSKGKPYRKSIFSNWMFLSSLLLTTAVCIYITVDPADWIRDVLEMRQPPHFDGPLAVLLLAVANFFCCYLLEDFLIEWAFETKAWPFFLKRCRSKERRSEIEPVPVNEITRKISHGGGDDDGGHLNNAFTIDETSTITTRI